MKKRNLKLFKRITLAIFLILLIVFAYSYTHIPISIFKHNDFVSEGNIILDKELSIEQAKEDGDNLISIIESTHPIFLETVPDSYKLAKVKFLESINKNMKVSDFQIYVSEYMSSINDGHTAIRWNETEVLDVNFKYINNKLFLLDDDNKITNKIVTEINGVEISKITNTISTLFPAENYAAINVNNTKYLKGKLLLTTVGVDCSKDMILTVNNKGITENMKVNFIKYTKSNVKREISSTQIDDKTLYVKFEICDVNSDLEKVISSLKSAIEGGTTNVIIDVSNNPGGNSQACSNLLDAIDIKHGDFGSVTRFSPLAQERYGFLRKSGSITYKRSNKAVKNSNVNLFIITNESTFSSAQDLATWVKDGNLGTIVGRASSNMPSSFGDVLGFGLDNSGIEGQVSYRKWTRPDATKDSERSLEPDFLVNENENSLDKVLEIIKNK